MFLSYVYVQLLDNVVRAYPYFPMKLFFLASLTFRFYSIEVQLDLKRCVFNNAIFFSVNIVGISAKSSMLRYRSCSKP